MKTEQDDRGHGRDAHPDAEDQRDADTEQAGHEQPVGPGGAGDGVEEPGERALDPGQVARGRAAPVDPRPLGRSGEAEPEQLVDEGPQEVEAEHHPQRGEHDAQGLRGDGGESGLGRIVPAGTRMQAPGTPERAAQTFEVVADTPLRAEWEGLTATWVPTPAVPEGREMRFLGSPGFRAGDRVLFVLEEQPEAPSTSWFDWWDWLFGLDFGDRGAGATATPLAIASVVESRAELGTTVVLFDRDLDGVLASVTAPYTAYRILATAGVARRLEEVLRVPATGTVLDELPVSPVSPIGADLRSVVLDAALEDLSAGRLVAVVDWRPAPSRPALRRGGGGRARAGAVGPGSGNADSGLAARLRRGRPDAGRRGHVDGLRPRPPHPGPPLHVPRNRRRPAPALPAPGGGAGPDRGRAERRRRRGMGGLRLRRGRRAGAGRRGGRARRPHRRPDRRVAERPGPPGTGQRQPGARPPRRRRERRARQRRRRAGGPAVRDARRADRVRPRRRGHARLEPRAAGRRGRVGRAAEPLRAGRRGGLRGPPRPRTAVRRWSSATGSAARGCRPAGTT